jgi:hypothetical protein
MRDDSGGLIYLLMFDEIAKLNYTITSLVSVTVGFLMRDGRGGLINLLMLDEIM